MTLAEDEARRVNLVASDEAEDFYSDVAAEVYPRCGDLLDGPDDRDLVKTAVMSWLYGSKPGGFTEDGEPFGMTRAIVEELRDRERSAKGAKQLAYAINDAIGKFAPRATAARDLLRKLAETCAIFNKPLRWETSLGLCVINIYQRPRTKRISTWPSGRRRDVKLAIGYHDRIRKRKSVNSVAANFVHSVDAAHMQMTALAAAAWGIAMVGVHDCFAAVAPQAERLNKIIREQFAELHKRALLAEVLQSARDDLPASIELPPCPERGTFDLEQVKQSFHAFA